MWPLVLFIEIEIHILCFTFIFIKWVFYIQKRRGQSNSRSEKFPQEEVASGFPIEPPRPSQAVEEVNDPQGNLHKRASHSGPLVHRASWTKVGRNMEDPPKISTGAELSSVNSLVAARRSLISEDRRDKPAYLQQETPKVIGRFPGSFKESSDSMRKQDNMQNVAGQPNEDGRNSNKDPILVSFLPS